MNTLVHAIFLLASDNSSLASNRGTHVRHALQVVHAMALRRSICPVVHEQRARRVAPLAQGTGELATKTKTGALLTLLAHS